MNDSKIRFRHIRVTETVRNYDFTRNVKHEHVLTLATRLDNNKLFVGFALNRVGKPVDFNDNQYFDRFSPVYGRIRAVGRLNSSKHIVLDIDPKKPMIDNIVQGLLALPTTGSKRHNELAASKGVSPDMVPSVPSALKQVLKKSLKEHKGKTRIEG